jgi:hypothetical protein
MSQHRDKSKAPPSRKEREKDGAPECFSADYCGDGAGGWVGVCGAMTESAFARGAT